MIKRQERLSGVNNKLCEVVLLAASICPVDIYIIEGLRTIERQRELVAQGKSKTMNSRHITGGAVDLWDGKSWDEKDFTPIIEAMETAAKRLNVRLTGGHNWGWDYPHWQIEK